MNRGPKRFLPLSPSSGVTFGTQDFVLLPVSGSVGEYLLQIPLNISPSSSSRFHARFPSTHGQTFAVRTRSCAPVVRLRSFPCGRPAVIPAEKQLLDENGDQLPLFSLGEENHPRLCRSRVQTEPPKRLVSLEFAYRCPTTFGSFCLGPQQRVGGRAGGLTA